MGVSIMFTKITTILAASLLLGGCMSSQPKDHKEHNLISQTTAATSEETKFVQLSVIKLYAQNNVDSSIILDRVNKELSKGKTVDAVLSSYGTYFTDVKLNLGAVDNVDYDFVSTNTTAHVAKITPTELVPGYYNTGITGNLKIKKLDDTRYVFNYKIKNATLRKLEVSPTNKLITIPDIKTKNFEQSLVIEANTDVATGITNPEPKQYEMFIVRVATKRD